MIGNDVRQAEKAPHHKTTLSSINQSRQTINMHSNLISHQISQTSKKETSSGEASRVRETSEGSNQKFKIPLGQMTHLHSKMLIGNSNNKTKQNLTNSGSSSGEPVY